MQIIPYLHFNGRCEEAIQTYIEAFGGELLYLSRWEESTCRHPGQAGKVMHAEFMLGRTPLSGGDTFEAGGGSDIRLMVHLENTGQAQRAIALLAAEGKVLSPLKPHPKPDDSGCGALVLDRFGYGWIITCPNTEKNHS